MPSEVILRLAREGLLLAVALSAPVVLAALAVGLVVSVLQATTQIQEPTLSFAPKLVAVVVALVASGPWIGAQLIRFTTVILEALPLVT